jgi:putative aldouronate transport system substrate-binding protein
MKKLVRCFLVVVIVSMIMANTTFVSAISSKPAPFCKMPKLIEFTTGRPEVANPQYAPGESIDNNDLTKYVEKKLNVKVKVIWTTSDVGYAFENKVNLLIASNNIPDTLQIATDPYGTSILKKLIKNNMIQDLTKVVADYASRSWLSHHAASGNIALKQMTFNGKLMAMPDLSDTESEIELVWVRQDWLDKLKLKGPKTVDDLAAIAKAFMTKDPDGNKVADTMGLLGCSTLYKNATQSFDFVFNAFKSYPGDWVYDSKKNVVYGSITPETKTALAKLAKWYKDGLLDKEFALKDAGKANDPIVSGKAGIIGDAWWGPWWPLNSSVQNDPKANWKAYGIINTDGKYIARGVSPARSFLVIRKGFAYPEAIVKANNIAQDGELSLYDWYNKLKAADGKYAPGGARAAWPVQIGAKFSNEISLRWNVVKSIIDGYETPESVDPQAKQIYEQMKPFLDEPDTVKNFNAWVPTAAWASGADALLKNGYKQITPAFSGTSDSMIKYMTAMNDLEKSTFTKIIMNQLPISAFDKFVSDWKKMGGTKITNEINSLVKK